MSRRDRLDKDLVGVVGRAAGFLVGDDVAEMGALVVEGRDVPVGGSLDLGDCEWCCGGRDLGGWGGGGGGARTKMAHPWEEIVEGGE